MFMLLKNNEVILYSGKSSNAAQGRIVVLHSHISLFIAHTYFVLVGLWQWICHWSNNCL